jgi:hypothetical protein
MQVVFAPQQLPSIIQKYQANSPLLFTTVQNYDSTLQPPVSSWRQN